MIRSTSSAVLLLALAACASTGSSASGGASVAESQRNTTLITSVDATGRSTVIPITTYSGGGAAPVRVEASADSVFAVLSHVYPSIGIPVGTSDPGNRTIGNTQVRATRRLGNTAISDYVDCGVTGLGRQAADVYPVRLAVISTVTPEGQASQVQTRVQAVYVTGEQSGTNPCTTKGTLEALIARTATLRVSTH